MVSKGIKCESTVSVNKAIWMPKNMPICTFMNDICKIPISKGINLSQDIDKHWSR